MESIDPNYVAHQLGGARQTGDGWMARCPSHDDERASLSISANPAGKLLVHCHAGCTQEAVIQSLRESGWWQPAMVQDMVYDYVDEDGQLMFQVVRKPDKRFFQRRIDHLGQTVNDLKGVKRVPYRLPEVKAAIELGEPVFICEGEKDADRLTAGYLAATTNNGGAGKWTDEHSSYLRGCVQAIILPDNDQAGKHHAEATAASLARLGIPVKIVPLPNLPPKGDVSNWLDAGGDIDSLLELCALSKLWRQLEQPIEPVEFGKPILLGRTKLPEITSDFLPVPVKDFVDALAAQTQTPPGLASMLVLSVLAACVQGKGGVAPYKSDSYIEPLVLWVLVALPPATRKTAVLQALLAPVIEWEREQRQLAAEEEKRESINEEINNRRVERLLRQASATDDPEMRQRCQNEIIELRKQQPCRKRARSVFVNDSTPEALKLMLDENDQRAAVLSDEGGLFQTMQGLYTDGKANIDVFLQGHSEAALRVKRRDREVLVDRASVTLGLAVQPQALADISSKHAKSFRGRGLFARFLYCIPESNVGSRNVRLHKIMPTTVREKYTACIKALLDMQPLADPLVLTSDALDGWQEFAQSIENEQGPGGSLEAVQDFTGKLPGQALRITGLCHLASNALSAMSPSSPVISKDCMNKAIDLCTKLIDHAMHVLDGFDCRDQSDATFAWSWIVDHAEQHNSGSWYFRRHDLHCTPRFKKSPIARVCAALRILEQRNLVSPVSTLPTQKPTIIHWINPQAIIADAPTTLLGDEGDKADQAS